MILKINYKRLTVKSNYRVSFDIVTIGDIVKVEQFILTEILA